MHRGAVAATILGPDDAGGHGLPAAGARGPVSDKPAKPKPSADPSRRALHRRVQELTADIGAVLHANTSTLFMAHHSLDVAIRALAPNPYPPDRVPTAQDVDAVLAQPVKATVRAIDKLLAILDDPDRADDGSMSRATRRSWAEELGDLRITLDDYIVHIPIEESRTSALRTIACRIQDILAQLPAGRLPREPMRNLRRAAHEIERLTALASLLQTRAAIMQMDYSIRSFREFVTTDLRRHEERRRLRVAALIEEAHRQLADYAYTTNVEIRPHNQAPDAEVLGVERDLVRTMANLLHNAVKYSWRRNESLRPWVEVRTYRGDGNIYIELENWGVPVSPHEIEREMVFELGYRGKWSTDRSRLGTGIGLTDARDVAERHRGSLEIRSRPARSWGPDDPEHEEYYRQPFLTTVTVCLPEAV